MKIGLVIYILVIFISATIICVIASKSLIAWYKKRNLSNKTINFDRQNVNQSKETLFT